MRFVNLSRLLRRFVFSAIALFMSIFFALDGLPDPPAWADTISTAAVLPAISTVTPQAEATSPKSFVAAAVKQVGAAVVRIDTERTVTRRSNTDPFLEDPFFRQFFGDDTFSRLPQQERLRGQGSGFIVDRNGVILTNAHVVDKADRVTVTLKDGRIFDGKVQGVDEITDLAVVKVNGKDLPAASLGDSDQVQVGDWAIAVARMILDEHLTQCIARAANEGNMQAEIEALKAALDRFLL